jgi:hypothetical protein
MELVQPGFVIVLRKGLNVYDVRNKTVKVLDSDTTVVVENTREVLAGSEDDQFLPGFVADARELKADGSYDHQNPLYTFAQYGSYRDEFCQVEFTLLRKMRKTWELWD